MLSRFISFEISSTVTHVKEKLASFSILDIILLIIEIQGCLKFIRNVRNIAEVFLVNFDSKIWYYINKEGIHF